MTDNAGWHPDATDPHLTRYWDGSQWTAERRWDGEAWVEQGVVPVATAATSPATAAAGFAMSRTSWMLFGGAAVAAIGVMLPWEQVSSSFGVGDSQTPGSIGGAALVLFGLVALVVWVGWPTREATLSGGRLLGLVAVAAAMTFFVIAKFNAIGSDQDALNTSSSSNDLGLGGGIDLSVSVDPGLGLWLWTIGVILVWVGVYRAWRARTAAA